MTTQPTTADAQTRVTQEIIAARIERLPISAWHARILTIVGAAGFFDAFDALTIAFVLPVLAGMWRINPSAIGALVSIGYAGQLLGAIGLGSAAETYGRRRVLRWTIAVMGLLSIACAIAWSYQSLFWFRFIQGLGLGAEVPIAATYINEFTPAAWRGRVVVIFQSTFAFGIMVTALAAIWIVPQLGWRWMFIAGALPAILSVVFTRLVPESPRWLASKGRLDEADAVVSQIELTISKGDVNSLPPVAREIPPVPKISTSWFDLFRSGYLPRTLTAWAMAFMTSIVGYGLLTWLPTIYRNIYHLPIGQNLRYSFVSYFVGLLGALTGVFLIDRFGRRPSYMISFLGAAAPLLLLWWYAHNATIGVQTVVVIASISLFFVSILLPAIYVYISEIYPTRMRALGSGVASAWLRVASIVGPTIVGIILSREGLGTVFLFFGAAGVAGALIVLLFAIETKGKTLEEIAP